MKFCLQKSLCIILALIPSIILATPIIQEKDISSPIAIEKITEKAKANNDWKVAFLTGKHGQVVFMSVSPITNPKNEIGAEVHSFDQIILVADGEGKAILNNHESNVKSGDLIFIPQGTPHNVINANKDRALKIISFYSNTDIPAKANFKTKNDETLADKNGTSSAK